MHNCIIYNGGKIHSHIAIYSNSILSIDQYDSFFCLGLCPAKHALTKIAKGIVKVCKEDVSIQITVVSVYSMTACTNNAVFSSLDA